MPTEAAKRESEDARKAGEAKPVAVGATGSAQELAPGKSPKEATKPAKNPPSGS